MPDVQPLRVYVIDDDFVGRRLMVDRLDAFGATLWEADNAEAMLHELSRDDYDVIVMDVSLPGVDGVTAASQARLRTDAGIILISVIRDARTRCEAIKAGADDFLVKPVHMDELAERVLRLGQRVRAQRAGRTREVKLTQTVYLDLDALQLIGGDYPIPVTEGEASLLRLLTEHHQCTRDELAAALGGAKSRVGQANEANQAGKAGQRSVDTIVARLRAKLKAARVTSARICAVRGVGYTLMREDSH